MAVDLFTFLSLPQSKAFTKVHPAGFSVTESKGSSDSRSESHPRKTPRLAADSDSASASRSRANTTRERAGPTVVNLQGAPVKRFPESAYDSEYKLCIRAIRVLLTRENPESLPGTYEKIYSACRAVVCAAQKGEGLYEHLKLEIERCIGNLQRKLVEDGSKDVEWLCPFTESCNWFAKQVRLLASLFAYLDGVYVSSRKDLSNINTLSYSQFSRILLQDATIVRRLRSGIQVWIEWERSNKTSHQLRDLIPALIDRLQHHNCYYELFQTFFDSITHDFYFAESAQLRKSLTAKKFLAHTEERSKEEDQRARKLFPDATRELILRTMDKALYSERLEWIAGEALPQFMEKQSPDALLLMYNKFSRVDGLKVLQVSFKRYVKEQVAIIVKSVAKEEKMVENLLQFKYFCDSLTADAFANVEPVTTVKSIAPSVASTSALPMDIDADTAPLKKIPNQEFVYALSDAFQQGFKARRNKPAEMIAKYLDKAMRKGQKGKEEVDFMSELDRVLTLYRYTDDKDVFRTFYHRALAKRLLLEKSASDDFEKMILKKLKEEYDPEFGMGDHMFKDLELSRGLMKEYTEHRERQGEESTQQKMSVMVLQRSFWPFSTRKEDADIPAWMQEDLRRYVLFYKTKHQGHKLDWDHSLGTASLRARFKAAEKELSVSLYQAVVLLLFNEGEQIPFAEIKSQTRMGTSAPYILD
ncbi:hypothetical protein PHLCEN_2v3056 [Hermanssonia centrifuga]|uniref:Cullin family profile domain-containing protein n=1 Tax=Hermanssonia centrifuga TaxID=98765 RepID=A0A2R6R7A0_9APHY|nr:hypothetical protein PHLCEN_2v3056 [Hermanssonia centrifuga]